MDNNMVLCRFTNGNGEYLTVNTHRGLPIEDGTIDNFVYEVTSQKECACTLPIPKELIEICKNYVNGEFYPEEVRGW